MALMTATERPAAEPDRDDLLQAFLELSTPEGFRAELIEGEISVTPPPDGEHGTVISCLAKQFFRLGGVDLDVLPDKGLVVPHGRFIPDGVVTLPNHFRHAEPWADATGVLLVFEVTSTRPEKDLHAKRLGYAAAGIPCYLLVDRARATVTLFTDPENDDYTACSKVTFGKPLTLPAPFSFDLDTAPFA